MPIVPRKEIELYAHVLLVMKEIRTLNAGSILAKAPVAVSMLNVKEEETKQFVPARPDLMAIPSSDVMIILATLALVILMLIAKSREIVPCANAGVISRVMVSLNVLWTHALISHAVPMPNVPDRVALIDARVLEVTLAILIFAATLTPVVIIPVDPMPSVLPMETLLRAPVCPAMWATLSRVRVAITSHATTALVD